MANGSGNVSNVLNYTGITHQGQTGPVTQGATVPFAALGTAAANFVTIGGGTTSSTGQNFYFLSATSAGQYQVPSGKTFYITDVYIQSGSTNVTVNLGYGTAALGSNNTATPPTGATELMAAGLAAPAGFVSSVTASVWQHYSFPGLSFPANSYTYFEPPASSQAWYIIVCGIVQ